MFGSRKIIQAPMAGGSNTIEMAIAVCKAGGVASFGFGLSSPQIIEQTLQDATQQTNGPINANFFIYPKIHESYNIDSNHPAVKAIESLYPDIPLTLPKQPFYPNLHDQMESVWKFKPSIVTFHFGIPPEDIIQKCHISNIKIGISATSLTEAKTIERSGADFVIAQGIEAGGHRGIFDPETSTDEKLSTIALVSLLHKNIHIPVVAAGGIMDGADIYDALQHGASAVQMGTAFLTTEESGASMIHKTALLSWNRNTTYTRHFSGRPAQGIENEFIKSMQGQPFLQFPLQNAITGAIRRQSIDGEAQSLWAGQNFKRSRQVSVQELFDLLAIELEKAHSYK